MTFPVSDKPADHVGCSQSLINKWPVFSLGELCRIIGGGTPSKKNPGFYSGDIPWVTVKDFGDTVIRDTIDHITEDAVERSATNLVPAGTVLVVTRVGLGKVAITGRDMAINQDIKALFPDERVLPEYLFWFLVSKSKEIERMGTGATVKGITLKQLKSLSVPLPSYTEQCRIVDILNRADSICRLRKQAIDTARQLTPALFIDMFGDPAANPKGWPLVKAGSLMVSASYGTSKKANTEGNGIPVLRMGNVSPRGDLFLDDLKFVELDENEKRKHLLQKGDILFNRTNSKELVGKTGIWHEEWDAVAASYFIVVRLDRSKVVPEYFWVFMNSGYMKKRLFETARGAIGQANINAKELKSFDVLLPSLDLQKEFATRLADIQSVNKQQEAALQKTEQTFQSILDGIFADRP